jgi:hypothetical protein
VWARAGRLRSVAAVVATVLLACHATGMAISYTVQVIAVSDQDSALGISRELLRDGYPAYVVRSTGAQGDVYRVRVGAFANRAAALRYSETMPDVAGSRPVPALAEAIPLGIMPLAPRLLWQHEWSGEDVWVLPWPAGVAVRVQPVDPLRQATYVVFQDGEERAFEAWAAVPLRELPDVLDRDLIDVPIIDLTEPEAGEPAADEPVANEPPGEPAADEPVADEPPAEPAVDAAPPADEVSDLDLDTLAADPDGELPEAGVALLRDRWLWPPSWEEDGDAVRTSFRASLVNLVARDVELPPDEVDALAYWPGGGPPPALVVLDVSDRTARDAGVVLALADPRPGMLPWGTDRLLPEGTPWSMPSWPAERVRPEDEPSEEGYGGDAWQVTPDGAFVRITMQDGATWRAGVGSPLWSDGRAVLAWDGERLLLYDFVPR